MSIYVPAIIPIPQKMKSHDGEFTLDARTRIFVDTASRETGEYLAERLRKATGYRFPIGNSAANGGILLTTDAATASLGPDRYQLQVGKNSIVIRAPESAGLFYGVQSLLQLLPPEIFAPAAIRNAQWKIPCVEIEDWPRFKWRGFMLDVSRHFYDEEEVKRLLDAMAMHKLNTFHWHLVDDQGWRIEIEKYPKLTKIGAWRDGIGFGLDPKSSLAYGPDGRYGGFYTRKDIREVVAYAQSRHITIVPEIEMPGHSMAALAAYPEFSCKGESPRLPLKAGIFEGTYCAGNDGTFDFLQDVLLEIFKLFPGQYIHVGGDEVLTVNWKVCPKCQARMKALKFRTESELENYFIRRISNFIRERNRIPIGWSEIYGNGLARNTAVMDWIGLAVDAVHAGHDVVMATDENCYLDQYQSKPHFTEPLAGHGFLPVNRIYSFEPVPAGLRRRDASHILGLEGNLWTEYVAAPAHAEFMAFPRLSALAEVGWSAKSSRNWKGFSRRLQIHYERLDQLGIAYCHYPYNLPARSRQIKRGAKPSDA